MSTKLMNSTILAYFHAFSKFRGFDSVDVKELCEKVRKCGYLKISKTLRLKTRALNLGLFEPKKAANLFGFLCKPAGLPTFS